MKRVVLPLALGFIALATSCDSPHVERLPVQDQGLDDRITLHGTVCTKPPDTSGFPVKVLFVVDQSGSMCITDPPDSQKAGLCSDFMNAGGGAEVYPDGGTNPAYAQPDNFCETDRGDGAPYPGRVCAIYQVLKTFRDKPNVEASVITFDSTVNDGIHTTSNGSPFDPVTDQNFDTWVSDINKLKTGLGKTTDYEGAFAEAYDIIAQDISCTLKPSQAGCGQAYANASKSDLPRTRYVLVFITDGTPYPRCAADDNLPPQDYATAADPDLIWADSEGVIDTSVNPPQNYCNEEDTAANGTDLPGSNGPAPWVAGVDRNQNYQILDLVDRIMALQQSYNVHSIQVHTVLLWNAANIETLSDQEKEDIFGDVGNCTGNACVDQEHDVAEHLLQEIAQHGNGTYQQFIDVTKLDLGSLDYTSLASPYVMKSLIVDDVNAHPEPDGQVPDSDGDGLPDDVDNQTVLHTNGLYQQNETTSQDTDGDGFSDLFEYLHAQEGFDPTTPDLRTQALGCSTDATGNTYRLDSDGDGLPDCTELYLGTSTQGVKNLVDTDADGIPDGLEVKYGLDPTKAESPLQDSDGDGVPDLEEIRAHTDPHVADPNLAATESYRYAFSPSKVDGGAGANCYDYSVSNIRMVTTQSEQSAVGAAASSQNGFNHFIIYFDEAPASDTTEDYGDWKMACANAQFSPPSVRVPQGPDLEIDNKDFIPSDDFVPTDFAWGNRDTSPSAPHCVNAQ